MEKNLENNKNTSSISNGAGKNQDGFKTWYAISFAFQLGFVIVAPIGGFILLSLWGDRNFHTTPFLLIGGIIIGVIVTVYEVYHLMSPLIRKND